MNLSRLFQMQNELDKRIVKEHGLEGQNLLPKKILALQVELGELTNEWRGFKFWSKRKSPVEPEYNWKPSEDGENLISDGIKSYPLLDEYVDCLHFILSIGLEIRQSILQCHALDILQDDLQEEFKLKKSSDVIQHLNQLFYTVFWTGQDDHYEYIELMETFLGLGEMLGFSLLEIEQAYISKNEVNHQRQDNGY
ncbi:MULTISPECIES: dUTP diphosphatase [Bacillus cereus group]|uniref:dUTP diphosphatase n=1 Tax=Bacillus cereus group TaxID=86661 RepID=UPI001AEE5CC4|nr:dUTP diphosphatase [Bacillus cytotoxicus]QTR80847.1 dUTP diphosphatase [Bacillus cytotoxicus]